MKKVNKMLISLIAFSLIIISGCTPATEEKTETEEALPIAEVQYCNLGDSTLCLEGFGKENEENLIILFKSEKPDFEEIYLRINEETENIPYQCSPSQEFPKNIYCIGEIFPNGEEIEINIYTKNDNAQIATGGFTIQYGNLQLSDDTEFEDSPTFPNSPDYPNDSDYPNAPDYPNYPN